ncbi:MAG: penicillin-binding transpeptidase domain-containing protein [Acidobacteriota bacterium]
MLISYALTIILEVAALLLMILMAWAAWRHRNPPADENTEKESGPSATNRWLRGLRAAFVLAIVAVIGFHFHWAFLADSNENFIQAKKFDARNRRFSDSALLGWVLDRTGRLENSLIRYRADRGSLTREYPLGEAAAHLTGYFDFAFGAGGMEYAYRDRLTESASAYNRLLSPSPVGKDIKVTIDAGFQSEVYNLLRGAGKPSAAVVLLLPKNEVLAMASTPSFDPRQVRDQTAWTRLTDQAKEAQPLSPLVNRALGTLVTGGAAFYYRPGSTFKTFIAAVAIDSGVTEEKFECKPEGFVPPGASRPIRDYGGEVHGTIGLEDAFRHSCNQYFSQLGIRLGRERLSSYARRLGFAVSSDDASRATSLWNIGEGEGRDDFNFIFAPPLARMHLSPGATAHDIALQAIGEGFDDMTVMDMALLASAVASEDGSLAAPVFDPDSERKVISQFVTPQSAERVREMMRSVVEGGTARGGFARSRITAGGKTGTADRIVPVYDRQGKRVVDRVSSEGVVRYKTAESTDSWFIGFAPADNPKIVYAVLVEDGGEGARAAVPLAVKIIERAAALGYLK